MYIHKHESTVHTSLCEHVAPYVIVIAQCIPYVVVRLCCTLYHCESRMYHMMVSENVALYDVERMLHDMSLWEHVASLLWEHVATNAICEHVAPYVVVRAYCTIFRCESLLQRRSSRKHVAPNDDEEQVAICMGTDSDSFLFFYTSTAHDHQLLACCVLLARGRSCWQVRLISS